MRQLPAVIRRQIQDAIDRVLHPKGMHTGSMKAQIDVSILQYVLKIIDEETNGQTTDESKRT